MSSTRTYQAYTMAEALAAVKYDLGAEAIILSTRTFKRGGLLGLGRRTVVEVTAANQRESTPPAAARQPGPARPAGAGAADKAYAGGKQTQSAAAGGNSKASIAARGAAVQALASEADRQRTRRVAMAMQENQRRAAEAKNAPIAAAPVAAQAPAVKQASAIPVSAPITAATGAASPAAIPLTGLPRSVPALAQSNAPNSLVVSVPSTPMSVAAKRFILRSADTGSAASTMESNVALAEPVSLISESGGGVMTPIPPIAHTATATTPAGIVSIGAPHPTAPAYAPPHPHRTPANGRSEVNPAVQQELAAIKNMVGQVLQRQTSAARQHTPSMPPKLFDVYLRLVGMDVPDDLADLIINEMREQLGPAEIENDAALRAAAIEHLADHIPVAPTPLNHTSPNSRPLTIALVGPTGVGKTTTLAKLAASFKLKAGRRVGLITSDTYRIAAVDQLRTYANIIGLPLQVALTPADMRQAIHSLNDCEVILVDTAGRSQKDAMRIAELRQFIEAAHPHEVHMVLSATAGEKVLASEAEAFGRVGVNKLILTKMDEAASLGGVMNLLRLLGKPVSFITTGQEVPDHLEPAQSHRLAELMLGGPVHD